MGEVAAGVAVGAVPVLGYFVVEGGCKAWGVVGDAWRARDGHFPQVVG